MKFKALLFFISFQFILSSCGGSRNGGNNQEREENQGGGILIYDNELSSKEVNALDKDFEIFNDRILDGSNIRRFSDVFSGNNSSDVYNYLDERLNYILSATTKLEDRVTRTSNSIFEATTLASNQGTALWFEAIIRSPENLEIEINNKKILINSSRIGIVQLGEAFPTLGTIWQLNTLVHEARHSDCSGGIYASDIERLKNDQLPLNHACGHIHDICPLGHDLEGEYACDSHAWGAYAIESIYAAGIAFSCGNCSETEKSVSEQILIDSASRLLYDIEDLLDGLLGKPDMTSSAIIR